MSKNPILVVGGAGYIGSHVTKELLKNNYDVIVFDNLENGRKEISQILNVKIEIGDLRDFKSLSVLDKYNFDSVFNFAAYASVGESVKNPIKYFENNYTGNLNLYKYLVRRNIKNIIFSSTSEVYGEAQYLPIDEGHPINPMNPYGLSKYMVEQTIDWLNKSYDINYVIFRYFNAAGCSHNLDIGEMHKPETHLIPNAVLGAMGIKDFKLTSSKVDTPDGTPIRDFVHVEDLANAHVLGLKYLENQNISNIFNLGTGKGYSVLEVVKTVEKVCNVIIEKKQGEVRQGEPAKKYASFAKAKKILGWNPRYDLEDMAKTTYDYFSKHKNIIT